MSQLLIIDVQQTFEGSQDLDASILKLSKKFKGNVIYCYDTVSGEGVWPHDMWMDMAYAFDQGKFKPTIITKQYNFFREIMETYENDEFIIDLARLMMAHKVFDAREIEDLDSYEEFDELFEEHSIHPDFHSELFWIPIELIDSLRENIQDGVSVVGGGRKQCLKEVCLLLDILDIKHTVIPEYTY
jgi:hypothetical protein